MSLTIDSYTLGPLQNNSYLIADPVSREAALIDPTFESTSIIAHAQKHGFCITGIWVTHAHFDHIAGVNEIITDFCSPPPIGLHPADLDLWHIGGGAQYLGYQFIPRTEPTFHFHHGQRLQLGNQCLEVRHAPGHSPGHVIFYAAETKVAFCGDVIFRRSIGRTDLHGGDHATLIRSINTHIFTLPHCTRLLCGHGPETTVAEEASENPFL